MSRGAAPKRMSYSAPSQSSFSRSMPCAASRARISARDRKSTRLNSSHTEIYTLSLHDALPTHVQGGCAEKDVVFRAFAIELQQVDALCRVARQNFGEGRRAHGLEFSPLFFCGDAVIHAGSKREPHVLPGNRGDGELPGPYGAGEPVHLDVSLQTSECRAVRLIREHGPGAAPRGVQGKRAEVRSDIHHRAAGRETPVVLAHQDHEQRNYIVRMPR